MMLFVAAGKSTAVYLWLFALFRLGRGQGIENTSEMGNVINANHSCLVPPQPTNGERKLHRSLCGAGGEMDCDISQGLELEPGSHLVYRCIPGYKIRGSTDVYCGEEGSWSPLPACMEIKCNALKSRSTRTSCTSPLGDFINCDSPMPPGTRAEISCSLGYKEELSTVSARGNQTVCDTNGNWKPDPLTCIPAVCGEEPPHQTSWNSNGNRTRDFPWHASIYLDTITANRSEKVFTCDAVIIRNNFLITAARCIYDKRTNTTVDPRKLFVMVGNVVPDYDSPLHNPVTVGKEVVKNVYKDCPTLYVPGDIRSHIALLELQEPLHLSEIVLPACLDLGSIGAEFENKDTAMAPLPCSQCRSSDVAQYRVHIGTDKFCARYINGSAVCDVNKSSDLVIEEGDLWQIMGFVGVDLGVNLDDGETTCGRYPFSIHVRVSNYFLHYNG